MQRTEVRIVAGSLRGRKLACAVHSGLRPTPQMVREACFSILGNAIPDRLFVDVFSGTGVVGMEAISRGARQTVFVEKDPRSSATIEQYLQRFGIAPRAQVFKTDAYRWAERWILPTREPINVFLSPPFLDLHERPEDFLELVETLCDKLPEASVVVIQAEEPFPTRRLPNARAWDCRKYGRNLLLIWVKEPSAEARVATEGSA